MGNPILEPTPGSPLILPRGWDSDSSGYGGDDDGYITQEEFLDSRRRRWDFIAPEWRDLKTQDVQTDPPPGDEACFELVLYGLCLGVGIGFIVAGLLL